MAIRDVFRWVVLLTACFAVPAEGQRLVVLPGAASSASTGTMFSTATFAPVGTINAIPHAFLAFGNQAGSRFYVITTSGLVVVSSSGTQVQTLAISPTVTGAALSPDGRKLVATSGTSSSGSLTVFDVSGNTASQTAVVTVDNNAQDVAVSSDSKTAWVVSASGVTPVDLGANSAGTLFSLAGLAPSSGAKPGISVGPNGPAPVRG